MSRRFPAIRRWLRVESSGYVDDDFHWWDYGQDRLSPAERAAAYEQWAEFWEWRLALRAEVMAGDPWRWFVEEWTDSMAYLCRRQAVYARGEDPGEWVDQRDRRPDLEEAKKARAAKLRAELDARPAEEPVRLRRVG